MTSTSSKVNCTVFLEGEIVKKAETIKLESSMKWESMGINEVLFHETVSTAAFTIHKSNSPFGVGGFLAIFLPISQAERVSGFDHHNQLADFLSIQEAGSAFADGNRTAQRIYL